MAATEHMTPGAEPVMPTLPDRDQLMVRYDRRRDTLFITVANPGPAMSVDIDGELWLRLVPETRQVVGVEIEDFEHAFLKRHPDIARAWREGRPRGLFVRRQPQRIDGFLDQAIAYLRQIFATKPKQLRLQP